MPGCATGEEAYSLAILLLEYAESLCGGTPKFQIFATDIDELAIGTARAARYPSTLVQGMSAERLARFFVQGNDGSYIVCKEVRDLCTFSAHSLTRDPPFSKIDLVSCRNVLIYLDADLQSVVVPVFHYSLVPDGILLLGSSESISRYENLFETVDRTHRIFRRRDTSGPPLRLSSIGVPGVQQGSAGVASAKGTLRPSMSRTNNRASARVLERFGPAFVVVGAEGNVVQYSARIGRFLEPPPGAPDQNVLTMARRGLATPLRSALKEAVESGRPVERGRVSVTVPGEGRQWIRLAVEPMREQGAMTLYLVAFVEFGPNGNRTAGQ